MMKPVPDTIHLFRIVLIFALVTTSWYNLHHNPHLLLWLCNFTAILALILVFFYHQVLFDLCFYFAWTGDVFTLLIVDNPVAPPVETDPIAWTGFILKHGGPLLLTIHLVKNDHRKLSNHALKTVLITMMVYTAGIACYNLVFDQNILDLRWATLPLEQSFGPWPIYVMVNMAIAVGWYLVIYLISRKLNIVASG
jgi:uncharacterized membrane protein YwaF